MRSRMPRIDRVTTAVLGPMDFWREMNSLQKLARADGRTYRTFSTTPAGKVEPEDAVWLTFEEWDYLFERAVEAGIMAVHDDGKGNPSARFSNPWAMGLLRMYREIGKARAEGIDALECAKRVDAAIETEMKRSFQASRDADRAAAERRENASDELRSRRNQRPKVRDGKTEAAGGW